MNAADSIPGVRTVAAAAYSAPRTARVLLDTMAEQHDAQAVAKQPWCDEDGAAAIRIAVNFLRQAAAGCHQCAFQQRL